MEMWTVGRVLSSVAIAIAVGLAYAVLSLVIKSELAWRRYKRSSRGLPMLAGRSLLGNHTSLQRKSGFAHELMREHKRLNATTLGLMYNDSPVASTLDLDLVKSMILDRPQLNCNKRRMHLPVREIEFSILRAQDDDWRRFRRCIAPALRANIYKSQNVMHELEGSIEKLMRYLDSKSIGALDESGGLGGKVTLEASELALKYTQDLTFACFFKQYNLIDYHEEHCPWVEDLHRGVEALQSHVAVGLGLLFNWFVPIVDWVSFHFHHLARYRKRLMVFVKQQAKLAVEARRELEAHERGIRMRSEAKTAEGDAAGAQQAQLDASNFTLKDGRQFRRNMVDHVIDHFLEGNLTSGEYLENVFLLAAASNKTSADTICNALHLLAWHQDKQAKVRQAIRVDGEEAEYLAWALKETLRLMPPTLLSCSRVIKEQMRTTDGKHTLPAGTYVLVNAFAVHRLEQYWGKDAEEFRPERWSDTSHHHPMQYVPFGAGIRGCPGRGFAMHQMKHVLARLLLSYELETSTRPDAYNSENPFLFFNIMKSPVHVTFKRMFSK